MDGPMTLRVLTPGGAAAETACDSVQLFLRDGADGTGGGLVGIRRGHTPAALALDEGPLWASLRGKEVLRLQIGGGFASVRDDVITVLADRVETLKTE